MCWMEGWSETPEELDVYLLVPTWWGVGGGMVYYIHGDKWLLFGFNIENSNSVLLI